MTPSTLYRAGEAGVNVSTGQVLDSGEDYRITGEPHPEDQAHIDEGRLIVAEKPAKAPVAGEEKS